LARYRDSVCKLCRNEGVKLFLKGSRCETPKCAIERRAYPSGQHGQARKKLSEYALQLREKQKVRRLYGVQEKQFRRVYKEATRRTGVTGTIMFQLLETRLDNIIYRSGLALSRAQARQAICHGHFMVNGHKLDIPSARLKMGDMVTVRDKSRAFVKSLTENKTLPTAPEWMEADQTNLAIRFSGLIERHHVDATLNEARIIEYYSR
jgi:small subunit ribosomal protein S4